ncbi:MAG: pyridoxine 5'-phosphate synthase, partial [Rhodospirillales bacterium]|nr:pyridoxine 5'-phosphate synthase [Rhodospirillales bacterium]
MSRARVRLGVNIDHVATIRNARGGRHPDPVRAARIAAAAGADGITVHLREDRRHISDADVNALRRAIPLPLNLEMAATEEMVGAALVARPARVCLVPERRAELTTEGGLDLVAARESVVRTREALAAAAIPMTLFIDPDIEMIARAPELGAHAVELHTGRLANAAPSGQNDALAELREAAASAAGL